jgi:predicted 2-oxoglutarate/Fe(II)-dependent dioxygenase YbiX
MTATTSRFAELNDVELLYLVEDVFDAALCQRLIERIDAGQPMLTTQGTPRETIRHNSRAIESDATLADQIFQKVRTVVPKVLVGMSPVGANECLRFYRYSPGDYFKPHQDTDHQRSPTERSLLSVVVYLNGGYDGGEIAFPAVNRVITPKAGLAAVFGHRMVHESRLLTRGTKYAVRSDIMYRALG